MEMISEARRKKINSKFRELIKACEAFASEEDYRNISKAYEIAFKAELEKYKKSGDLNIMHSLEISLIAVNEIGLSTAAVISTLLHNLLETGALTLAEVKEEFGPTIATIVGGFRELSNLQTGKLSAQSENFRKLFLTIVDDIRVILIKVAHRLYDMRNYEQLSDVKQEIYLDEVTYLYIPIAHRLGLYNVKADFEELTMKYSHPKIYQSILDQIKASKTKQKTLLNDFLEPIQKELMRHGFDCTYKSRPKSVFSIWAKMKRNNLTFEDVYDLLAIRIISNSEKKNEKEDCWRIYSIVTDIYQPNPKRLRDWISTPKASGYESLHTTVKSPGGHWVEVQIRTTRMDEVAERGQAAHWRYKGFGNKKDSITWLNQVRDILENPEQLHFDEAFDSKEIKKSDKIFVFTPNGDVKQLPVGSTVLDFAYEIHSDVGSKCSGAKVNNKNVPIRHELNNGDKVEVITSKNQKPKLDWLSFVITNRAKGRIKRAMLEERFHEAEAGSEILKRKFKNWKIPFNDATIDRIIKFYKFKSSVDLYYLIATEKLDPIEIRDLFKENTDDKAAKKELQKAKKAGAEEALGTEQAEKQEDELGDILMINDKLKNVNYSLAKCCNPISGDSVFGFVTVGKGITIHRTNCPNAVQLLSKYKYRVIDVKWQDAAGDITSYIAKLKVIGKDSMGIVGDLTTMLSKNLKINMQSISVEAKDNGTFEAKLKLHIKDTTHLEGLIRQIQKMKGVEKVSREIGIK